MCCLLLSVHVSECSCQYSHAMPYCPVGPVANFKTMFTHQRQKAGVGRNVEKNIVAESRLCRIREHCHLHPEGQEGLH